MLLTVAMRANMKSTLLFSLWLLLSVAYGAEVGAIQGIVTENGRPLKGATIRMVLRGHSGMPTGSQTAAITVVTKHVIGGVGWTTPIAYDGLYVVKTEKYGKFAHFGLPIGTYDMAVEINGQIKEQFLGVEVTGSKLVTVDFTASATPRRN
jgi:hypothetical protein